ncbi:PREDICTED: uncharacterized protein LOC109347743 isoform X2 [Lupinus angustifolius]|uniref:uncharacterized protein LOC109347743 isoform X2 n=1 Tax=Lupinus angustifolius TaxID=3871 RepID=UPI00092F1B90|nr:PREDICTED: uncharacterized protein LOC109347743 isoform X2 [Lupinus angustifolius]
MSSSSNDNELDTVKRLKHLGKKLLKSHSHQFDDQLLQLLNELALVLSTVDQAPTEPIQKSLVPSMKALISDELLRHTDENVKISVTCCITEITRIAAPEAPYDDDQMKEIFKLIVAAFGKLSHVSSRSYEKVLTITDNVAKVRLCLVMLDLQCDDLVIEMFQHFLRNIRSHHLGHVFDCTATIMTLVLDESEEISSDLLRPLLDSVRVENQKISPISWILGEKVITNCEVTLRPYLMKAVESSGRALHEYAQIVAYVCHHGSVSSQRNRSNGSKDKVETKGHEPDITCVIDAQAMDDTKPDMRIVGVGVSTKDAEVIKKPISKRKKHSNPTKHSKSVNTKTNAENGNLESEQEPKSETRQSTVPRKRGRKPNSLLNAEEGYDNSWISKGTESGKSALSRKARPASRKDKLQLKPKTSSEALDSEPRSEKIVKPAQSRKTQDIGNVVPLDVSPASHKDNVLSQPEDMSKGHKASISKPKTGENTLVASPLTNDNIPHGSRSKRGRSRKRSRTDNQDDDSKSVSKLNEGNLNPRLKETSLESSGVRLEKEPEARKDAEAKPQISIRKIKFLWKDGKTAVAPESAVTGIETKASRDNKRRLSATPKEDVNESSAIKELSTKAAKSQARRRTSHAPASETHDLGDSLVGSRIKVWWPLDKTFYEGVVDSYDPVKGKHKILYSDGEMEVLNLKKQRWEVIAVDVSPDEEQGFALHKLAEASDIAQKIKEEPDLELDKAKDINFRSRGRTSASISKSGSAKSSVKSADTYADKSMDDQPGTASRKDIAKKPRSKRMKTGSDSDNKKNKPKTNGIEKEKAHVART